MRYMIALDIGTMSTRAFIYDEEGNEVFVAAYDYHAIFKPPGLVEQNPADWRNGTITTLTDAAAYARQQGIEIEAIVVTSQRASIIPVDWTGRELHNAITWQDRRSVGQRDRLVEEIGLEKIHRITGLRANPYFSLPKMVWLKEEMPDLYASASKIIGVQDYVLHLLTDQFVTDHTQAARTMLMNINTFEWDPEMFEVSGIDPDYMCELVPPGTSIPGGLRRGVATITGLRESLPVIVGGGDQQCAALALNVMSPGKALANTGTGSFVVAFAEEPAFEESCRTLCSAAALPGKWILEAGIFNTGAVYRWFREQFVPENWGFKEMDKEADAAGIGSGGVVMLPHFEGAAAPFWNPLAKGLFFNLSLGTTRGDMERAILEGICFEINENLGLIDSMIGKGNVLNVSGGMVVSGLFNQIQADISERKVVRHASTEASSLGAAISAAVTLGWYKDYDEAFRGMAEAETIDFEPVPEASEKYEVIRVQRNFLYDSLNERRVYEEFAG